MKPLSRCIYGYKLKLKSMEHLCVEVGLGSGFIYYYIVIFFYIIVGETMNNKFLKLADYVAASVEQEIYKAAANESFPWKEAKEVVKSLTQTINSLFGGYAELISSLDKEAPNRLSVENAKSLMKDVRNFQEEISTIESGGKSIKHLSSLLNLIKLDLSSLADVDPLGPIHKKLSIFLSRSEFLQRIDAILKSYDIGQRKKLDYVAASVERKIYKSAQGLDNHDKVVITESSLGADKYGYDYDRKSGTYYTFFTLSGTLNGIPFELDQKVVFDCETYSDYDGSSYVSGASAKNIDYSDEDHTEESLSQLTFDGKQILSKDDQFEDITNALWNSKEFKLAMEQLERKLKVDFSNSSDAKEAAREADESDYESSDPMRYRGLSYKDFI